MKPIKKLFFSLFVVLSLPFVVSANSDTLTRPYPAPQLKRMTNDIVRLSADDMEGREPGTAGEKLAYEYIINELYNAGVAPAGKEGFLQPFTFNAGSYASANNRMRIGKKELEMKKDFFPLAYSANASFAGKSVKIKHGIAAPGRDDYRDVNVKGLAVVMEFGLPSDVDPHSKLAAYAEIRTRIDSAAARGAVAVIFINSDTATADPTGKYSNRITQTGLPVVFLNREAAAVFKSAKPVDVEGKTEILKNEKTAHNVIGLIDNQAEHTIVIGAHYDHLGYGNEASLYRGAEKAIHNGADDNASGTAGLLEIARVLKSSQLKNNNYLLVAFSAEELGLLGSAHLVKHLPVSVEYINCMLNMDMIGRLKKEDPLLLVHGVGTSPVWKTAIESIKPDGMRVKTSESGMGPSDHASFYLRDIPVLHFFSGTHDDYHKPSDDSDKINFEGQLAIIEYIMEILAVVNNNDGKIAFTKTNDNNSEETPRFKVTLGVVPDYGFDGKGMRIDGVSDGKPAKKAGMLAGDIVVKIGEHDVTDMMGYMKALGRFSKGEKATVTFLRNGETKTAEVEF
ncbi:MAG: M20/M25/M40 family metallo-hydrolase [Bacteroidota bacterium]|jgi:aminopeptidase YwaD